MSPSPTSNTKEDVASPMDTIEETISGMEMLEKIAELDYSQSQLRELNSEMRHWLDVADDDMAVLRAENASLRKQVKDLEKILAELQQVEVEPCGLLLADGIDENKIPEKKIQDLEQETLKVQEENKELTETLNNLKEEQDQDKIALIKLKNEFENLEVGVEEVQLELLLRDELIHQKNQQLKHLEETVEEYSEIIKDLRLMKQDLSHQLEERRAETSLAAVTEVMAEEEGRPSPYLSIAEEIQLLFLSADTKTGMEDSMDPTAVTSELHNIKTDDEKQLEPHCLTADLRTKRWNSCAVIMRTRIHKLFMLFIFSLCVLVFVACGCLVGNSDRSFTHRLLMLSPYVSVQYQALPPI